MKPKKPLKERLLRRLWNPRRLWLQLPLVFAVAWPMLAFGPWLSTHNLPIFDYCRTLYRTKAPVWKHTPERKGGTWDFNTFPPAVICQHDPKLGYAGPGAGSTDEYILNTRSANTLVPWSVAAVVAGLLVMILAGGGKHSRRVGDADTVVVSGA